jgi:1-acyl-sn-glycerol-3-phosphate acyltransferase
MIGTDKVQPIGKRLPNIRRIGMIFGEPLDFSEYRDQADDRTVQRKVTDDIMARLMRLSGQEYVDEYAAVVKLRLAGKPEEPQAAAEPLAAPVAAQGEFVQGGAAAPGSPASAGPVEEDDAGRPAAG